MFGSIHSSHLGGCWPVDCYMGKRLLRMLHDDQMRRFRQSPPEEREKHAERASQYRGLMDNLELADLIQRGARYASR